MVKYTRRVSQDTKENWQSVRSFQTTYIKAFIHLPSHPCHWDHSTQKGCLFMSNTSDTMNLNFKESTKSFMDPERDAEIREVLHLRKLKIDKIISLQIHVSLP